MGEYLNASRIELEEEVIRYCVMPGQALSYKLGEFKILELRKFAEVTLGDRFDIRGFHRVIIDGGMVPLGQLDNAIRRWVEKELKKK